MTEENNCSLSSTVFGSWERFKGGLRRGVLEEIGQESSLVNASRDGDGTESLGCQVVENSGLVIPKPRYPLLRHTSAPSTFGQDLVEQRPKLLPKGDRRAYSVSIDVINGIFPTPSNTRRTASPPASMYEFSEFLRQDLPRSRDSPEVRLPCPQIPRNNPIVSYLGDITPRPKIPHLVNVTEQPRDSAGGFPSERGWWNYFYSGGGAASHGPAWDREETTIRAPEPALLPMGNGRWSMDVEAANTPHTPLTEKALMKHQRRLRYKARISKLRTALRTAWCKFVDCFLLVACAIWWFISGCGCGLFG